MCSLQNPQQRTINSCQMNGQTRRNKRMDTLAFEHWRPSVDSIVVEHGVL